MRPPGEMASGCVESDCRWRMPRSIHGFLRGIDRAGRAGRAATGDASPAGRLSAGRGRAVTARRLVSARATAAGHRAGRRPGRPHHAHRLAGVARFGDAPAGRVSADDTTGRPDAPRALRGRTRGGRSSALRRSARRRKAGHHPRRAPVARAHGGAAAADAPVAGRGRRRIPLSSGAASLAVAAGRAHATGGRVARPGCARNPYGDRCDGAASRGRRGGRDLAGERAPTPCGAGRENGEFRDHQHGAVGNHGAGDRRPRGAARQPAGRSAADPGAR